MKIVCKLYTTSKTDWFHVDFPFLKQNLMRAKGVTDVVFDVEHITLPSIPLFQQGVYTLIDWNWFKKTLTARAKGYNAVGLHISRSERDVLGVRNANGAYCDDPDETFEFWVSADKGQRATHYPMSEFARLVIHELGGHGFSRFLFEPQDDPTHFYDYGKGGSHDRTTNLLPQLTSLMDFTEWNKLQAKRDGLLMEKLGLLQTLYQKLLKAFKPMEVPIYPIDRVYFTDPKKVSQRFAAPNTHYRSGVHSGVDFRCPIGTQVIAPFDGEIINRYSDHPTLGCAVYFKTIINGTTYYMRFLHLSKASALGTYKKGQLLGLTGNTGDSTGAHLHHDVWRCPIDVAKIRYKAGVIQWMIDPIEFYISQIEPITK